MAPTTASMMRAELARALLACTALALGGCGITAPSRGAGYAELESLGVPDTDRTVKLSIGPTLLHFAANHIEDDPEIVQLLRSLEGVRVRIYEIDGDAGRVAGRIERMSSHLRSDGWALVALIREKQEQTHMLLRSEGERIAGLTVLTSDGESEAVVVNLMGDIDPRHFGALMTALEIDVPGTENIRLADTD